MHAVDEALAPAFLQKLLAGITASAEEADMDDAAKS